MQHARGSAQDQHIRVQEFLEGSHEIPEQHAIFFSRLPYLGLATLDERGRPWATLLCTHRVTRVAADELVVRGVLVPGDPCICALASLKEPRLFAGVGIDYANRRRNKLNGYVREAAATLGRGSADGGGGGGGDDDGRGALLRIIDFRLVTTENMGNCPKYITVRKLVPAVARMPETPLALGSRLNAEARALLCQCSTAYLASRHTASTRKEDSDMGLNHRGGNPRFLRYFEEDAAGGEGGYIVLPDYSGNQLYQSLGNVQTDPPVGLIALNFATGDTLYVTGAARNLFGAAAERIMPRSTLLTLIRIEEAVQIRKALQVEMSGPEVLSPYNPPIRLLASELRAQGRPISAAAGSTEAAATTQATLISVERNSALISTFTFELSAPADVPPAGYAIFDFSGIFGRTYQHMNAAHPASLNDDLLRSWTVSRRSADGKRISVTIKRKEGGRVSSFLHSLSPPHTLDSGTAGSAVSGGGGASTAAPLKAVPVKATSQSLRTVPFRGYGGSALNCFSIAAVGGGTALPARMVWMAAGVGITPFLALYRALRGGEHAYSISILYSCRGDEHDLVQEMATDSSVHLHIFSGATAPAASTSSTRVRIPRRNAEADIDAIEGLSTSEAFICGPPGYMASARSWLSKAGVLPDNIHEESF